MDCIHLLHGDHHSNLRHMYKSLPLQHPKQNQVYHNTPLPQDLMDRIYLLHEGQTYRLQYMHMSLPL